MKLLDWFGVINGSLHTCVTHVLHNIFKTQFDGFLNILIFFKVTADSKSNTNTDFLM